jgi:hypothetical protein
MAEIVLTSNLVSPDYPLADNEVVKDKIKKTVRKILQIGHHFCCNMNYTRGCQVGKLWGGPKNIK